MFELTFTDGTQRRLYYKIVVKMSFLLILRTILELLCRFSVKRNHSLTFGDHYCRYGIKSTIKLFGLDWVNHVINIINIQMKVKSMTLLFLKRLGLVKKNINF